MVDKWFLSAAHGRDSDPQPDEDTARTAEGDEGEYSIAHSRDRTRCNARLRGRLRPAPRVGPLVPLHIRSADTADPIFPLPHPGDRSRFRCDGRWNSYPLNDPFLLTFADPEHSDEEQRYISLGRSTKGRVLVAIYTERGENIRLISCR